MAAHRVASGILCALVSRFLRRSGRCRHCGRPVIWLTRDDGKVLPFNQDYTVREALTHPEFGNPVNAIAYSDVHDCQERRAARRQATEAAHAGGLF